MSDTVFVIEPGTQEIIITRTFDAPRDIVFDMYTDHRHIPQWWGPAVLKVTVDQEKTKVRTGGSWRYMQEEPSGAVHVFSGIYHEVKSPERIIYTLEYENIPGRVSFKTIRFEEEDGKTLMIDSAVFQSVADRDIMVSMGVEIASRESLDRLAALLKTVKHSP